QAIQASATIDQDLSLKIRVTTESEAKSEEYATGIRNRLKEAEDNLWKDLGKIGVKLTLEDLKGLLEDPKDVMEELKELIQDLKELKRGLVQTALLAQILKTINVSSKGETLSIDMHGKPSSVWMGVFCYFLH